MNPKIQIESNLAVSYPQKKESTFELWEEFKAGSDLAFTKIYKTYIHQLYNYGERLVGDKELIEDSIHDFFVDLWNSRSNYGQISNLKFYLLKGFKYRLLKNIKERRKYSQKAISDGYDFDIVFSKEFEVINQELAQDQKEILIKTLNKLTPKQKEAITLRFYDALSYEEIALIMSISIKSVYKLIYKAIDFLKKTLSHFSSIFEIFTLIFPFIWLQL